MTPEYSILTATFSVRTGEEREFHDRLCDLNRLAIAHPGFVGNGVAVDATAQQWTATFKFTTDAARDAWAMVVAKDLPHEVQTQNSTHQPSTPTWKQAMLVLSVLYPLVTTYNMTLGNVAGHGLTVSGRPVFQGLGLPFPLVIFLGNAFGTVVLSWVVMPLVGRWFGWWLNPLATRAETVRGVLILVGCYVVEVVATVFIYQTWGF